jgi:hypothetical protein
MAGDRFIPRDKRKRLRGDHAQQEDEIMGGSSDQAPRPQLPVRGACEKLDEA